MSAPGWGGPGEQPRELLPPAEDTSAGAERPGDKIPRPRAGEGTGQNGILDAEIIEEPAAAMLVDQPAPPQPAPWRIGAPVLQPVIAPWLIDAQQRAQYGRWVLAVTRHWSLHHTIRLPIYALKALLAAPAGAAVLVGRTVGYVTDHEAAPLRAAAVRKEDAEEYLKLARVRADRVRFRRVGLAVVLALLLAAAFALRAWGPWWAQLAAVVAVVLVLAKLGQPADRPIVGAAVIVPKVQRLTSQIVTRALSSLGIAALAKGEGITFPAPITRDGPGWRADVELPFGTTVGEVLDKRDKLASGLRRPLGCVWPEPASDDHPGRLVLWVGDEDMSKAKQPAWPLRASGTVDLFQAQPFGTDQRGRYVPLTLMFTSVAIGAIPRMGKTFAVRELLLIAALDARAELHVYDNKGTGDLSPLECVAHRYGVGDDEDEIDAGLADMRSLRDELRRRTKVIRNLPRDLCPENKVTPELASKRSLGLHPIVVGVDECQVWFEHPDHGKEFEDICTDLVKRGPAVGIILIVATQRPDSKSLPSGISANVSTRFCLKVMDQVSNDMVLSTSAYKNGIRATMFAWSDKGIGYLRGEGADARIVRTVYLDGPASERIALRARAAREAAGLLSGHSIGEEQQREPAHSFLEDLWAVLQADDWLWSEVWVERLSELRPGVYGGWTVKRFAAEVRAELGLETHQITRVVNGERINRYGLTRDDLSRAIEAEPRREIE